MLNLSDAERGILMAAVEESGKIRIKEFADLMKGLDYYYETNP